VGRINRNAENYSIRRKLPLNRVPDKRTVTLYRLLCSLVRLVLQAAVLYDHGGAQEGGANAGG